MTIEQLAQAVEEDLGKEGFKSLKEDVRKYACKAARYLVARNGAPVKWSADSEGATQRFLREVHGFGKQVCRHLRRSKRYRFISLSDELFLLFWDTIRNRGNVWYDRVIQEVGPQCITKRGDDEWYDWLAITNDQLREIESRLIGEKISVEDVNLAACDVYVTAGWLFSDHLCVFGIESAKRRRAQEQRWFLPLLQDCEFNPAILKDETDSLRRMAEALKVATDEERQRLLKQWQAEASGHNRTPYGRLAHFVVSSAKSWTSYYAVCREHFGNVLPVDPLAEPKDWDWLTENSEYVMAIPLNVLLGQSAAPAEFLFRQATALAECLRHRTSLTDSNEHHGAPSRIKAIAIPYGQCRADGREPFGGGLTRSEAVWEFEMNCSPFRDPAEMAALDAAGLGTAFDAIDQRAEDLTLWKAVEHFEGALSLGGVGGALTESLEVLWKVAAFWTALEVRTPELRSMEERISRSGPVADYIEKTFREAGLSPSEVDHAGAWTRTLYSRRIEAVHVGVTDVESNELTKFRNLVATLLGIEISRHSIHSPR